MLYRLISRWQTVRSSEYHLFLTVFNELCTCLIRRASLLSLCHSQHRDRTIPVLIIGILVFLPGFYHLRIAYYASKGYRGYSYDDIPDFDDWATGTYCQPADVTEIWTSFSCRWCLPRHNDLTDFFFLSFIDWEGGLNSWTSVFHVRKIISSGISYHYL